MTTIDNTQDVMDSRDIIERLEELRDSREPFVAGWNMAGYMPDAEPCGFACFEDAQAYIREQLRDMADSQAWSNALLAEVEQAIEGIEKQGSVFSFTIGGYAFWVTDAENNGLSPEDAEELAALEAFAAQLEGYGDWEHGESVIREDYFTAYIEQLIDDCYPDAAKSANSSEWPYRHMSIDFEAAADEAKQDYTEAEFDGVTYLMRA